MTGWEGRSRRNYFGLELRTCCLAILVLAVLLLFLPVIGFEFLTLDDSIHVYKNRYLQNQNWGNLLHFWQTPHENLYIPLTYTVWAFLAGLSTFLHGVAGEFDPRLFHAANLMAHLGSSLVVFLILSELLDGDARAALSGALVFAVHPLQVEAVAWVTAFRDVFSVFWSLLALLSYITYAKKGGWIGGCRREYALATAFFVLAMLAKPGAVVLPLLAGLLGHWGFRRPLRLIILELSPWFALALPVVVETRLLQPGLPHDFVVGWGQRLLVAGDAVSFYCAKLLLPVGLCADYGRSPQFLLEHGWVWITGILPVLASLLLYRQAGRLWWLACSLFVAALLPVLGLIPFDFQKVSTVADRYLYLAMLGPALAVGMIAHRHRSRLSRVGWAAMLVSYGVLSAMQLRHWENSRAYYDHTLTVNPGSWYANNNLGTLLFEVGDYGQAEKYFRQAIALRPDFPEANNNLGLVLAGSGRGREAFAAYKKAIELAPGYSDPYGNLATLYRQRGMHQEAIDFYSMAIRRDPYRASFHDSLGVAYLEAGRGEEARHSFERALEVDPAYVLAYRHLISCFIAKGDLDKAASYQELAGRKGLDLRESASEPARLP
jgi:Flp pilus assembly protein TadD